MSDPITPVSESRRLGNSLIDESAQPPSRRKPAARTLDLAASQFHALPICVPPVPAAILLAPANPNRKKLLITVREGIRFTTAVGLFGSLPGVAFPAPGFDAPFIVETQQYYEFECTGPVYAQLITGPSATIFVAELLNDESQ